MARRKSKAKQEEEYFQGLMGLAAMGLALGGYYLTKSLQGAIIGAVVGVAVVVAIMIVIQQKRAERLKRSGIAEIDKMDGVQFEQYLGHLFRSQGYKAEVTKAAGGYGADLVLSKDGKRIVVQAKRYSKNVGLKAVQEVRGTVSRITALQLLGLLLTEIILNKLTNLQSQIMCVSSVVKNLSKCSFK